MSKTFADLGLSPLALEAIQAKGFEEPTDIQRETIPLLLDSRQDVIAQAQTGTGKTATFGLVFTDRIEPGKSKSPQAIVLAPTRELAVQVSEELNSLKGSKKLSIVPIYGGQSWSLQQRHLRQGVDIVVGTPGRVKDHLEKGTLKLDQAHYFVLDEADEMLNMGFIEDIEEILSHTKEDRQVLLFSATMPRPIANLAKRYMRDAITIKTQKDSIAKNSIDQIYFEVSFRDKFEALCRIIDMEEDFYGIVFCRTRRECDEVSKHLTDRGYRAEPIHGDIMQDKREKTLRNFKNRRTELLIATDVAARGIDVNDLTHVINYSLPQNAESYVHRIGRTGRAGKEGKAITLITPREYQQLRRFEIHAKADIQSQKLPDGSAMVDLKKQKLARELERLLSDTDSLDKYHELATELFAEHHPEMVVAALLKYHYEDSLDPASYKNIVGRKGIERAQQDSRSRDNGRRLVDHLGVTRLFLTTGYRDKATPKGILDMIEKDFGVDRKKIGSIDIMEEFSFVSVPLKEAEQIMDAYHDMKKISKPPVRVERASKGSRSGNKGRKKSGFRPQKDVGRKRMEFEKPVRKKGKRRK